MSLKYWNNSTVKHTVCAKIAMRSFVIIFPKQVNVVSFLSFFTRDKPPQKLFVPTEPRKSQEFEMLQNLKIKNEHQITSMLN